ncbi:MAG: hypothetical protein E6G10_10870 [Actinobacteria bacterium]|nr:MAG: hypothetical protein E6G10_10870 [Actinomycetota bacterium]
MEETPHVSELEHDCLGRYLSVLQDELGEELVAVWLFGSAARGDAWWSGMPIRSDVDLLVVTRSPLAEERRGARERDVSVVPRVRPADRAAVPDGTRARGRPAYAVPREPAPGRRTAVERRSDLGVGVGEVAQRQFRLLGELEGTFADAGVSSWLRGGWALDFLLGKITRDHADIDLVAWRHDRDAVHDALTARGYRHDRELVDSAVDFEKDGESIQVLLVEIGPLGALVCHGFEQWPFPEGSLEGPICRIGDVSYRTLAPHALLYEKETLSGEPRPPAPREGPRVDRAPPAADR